MLMARPNLGRAISASQAVTFMSVDLLRADPDVLDLAFASGGDAALEQAYQRYGSLIYSFCVRTVGSAAAADVTQEVFISAWRSRQTYTPRLGSLRAWLMSIAKNRCIDHWRSQRNRPAATGELADLPSPDHVDQVALRMVLADAVAELPDRQRTIVELAHIHGLTHDEVATRTGLPLGTVKSDLRRSMRKLASSLTLLGEGGTR